MPINVPFEIMVRDDVDSLSEAVVDVLEKRLAERVDHGLTKPLGLATGRTMEPIYSALVGRLKSWPDSLLDSLLDGWSSFNLDEYVGIGDGYSRSFCTYMKLHLGIELGLTPEQLSIPNGLADNPFKEASRYRQDLERSGGLGLLLLGLGSNGHLGFNEPPCGPKEACRVVSLSASTREQNSFAFGGNLTDVPKRAITLGLSEILAAEEIHLVVTGEAKANILSSFLNSSCSDHLPASWLKIHERVVVWADQAAFKSF